MTDGFSCSLDVLCGGLVICKSQFLIKKILFSFTAVKFLQFLVIKTLDLDPDLDPYLHPHPQWPKMLDLDPAPH
jgi:hypothetical protein